MESLGDILKRLGDTSGLADGGEPLQADDESMGPAEPCDVCGGRGWFTPEVPAGHPEFGRVITCQCQQERLAEEQSARLLLYSNLGHFTRFTFGSLDPEGRAETEESKRLFRAAHEVAVEYAEEPTGWLVFTGPHGSGKTHLAAAIANRCIETGKPVFFAHVPDLLDHLRASFAPTSELSYNELFEQVRGAPLLVLDALESQSSSPWAHEKLQQIINHRYNAQLPTVVTTASEMGDLDPYVRTRLEDNQSGQVIELGGRDGEPVHHLGRIEPELLRRMTFETFDVRGNNPTAGQRASLEEAYRFARNYAADPHGWLALFGDTTGVGKTHLAVAIAVERMNKGHPVFFAFVPELLDYLRYTFNPESRVTYDTLFDGVKNTPLLILDDLGQEHSSPWAQEKLHQIIVHRHNARTPTVITSTLDFTRESGPIASRVRDVSVGALIRIEAPDYRDKAREPVSRGRRTGAPSRKRRG